ncbi:hypothetical protein AK812_SmicGene14349 [Symbiodinium microadriaticum]|uniref:Uncharacterized protein n=1 Tax=Symbiodinium microadriaticum TaxID=2951 RepID=A0A1Q9E5S6_SYMMI|nr:hypothetical protein AK812_SmicGene14349 [Symbiodinium microadriaticum]
MAQQWGWYQDWPGPSKEEPRRRAASCEGRQPEPRRRVWLGAALAAARRFQEPPPRAHLGERRSADSANSEDGGAAWFDSSSSWWQSDSSRPSDARGGWSQSDWSQGAAHSGAMEASGDGSEERGRDPAAEPVAPGVQLDQAELEVEARGTGEQLRMVEDEVLEPPYGEPELVEPKPADVSPGPAEGARPEADEGEPRGEETLASLRHPEEVSEAPVEESPESWGHSDSRQSEESSRLQQLTSVLETLVQGQQALNNRLERVEEVRSSHSWRSAESSQGLGWVDQTALDRWYTEATARAAASGHRDANMYIAGRLDGGRRDLRSEAQALQDRAAQQRSEAQALQDRAAQQRSEAQVLQDRAAPQRSEAQGVSRKRGAEEVKIAGGGSESSAAVSTATKTTLSVGGDSSETEELVGATVAPTSQPTLPPGTKLQVRIDGQLRDVVVNENGGLETGPAQYYIGSLRNNSPPGDWLAAVAPLMRQLSSSAQTWWAQNLKEAEDHYERWLRATPQQRLQVKASAMAKSFDAGKYCLVEQRGVQLLLKAVPDSFRTDLIATRTLAVNAIVFAILCRWQPGGKLERAQVLDYLVHPEASGSVEETVEGIRKWRRMVLRASELGAVLPDSSLLLKGLDSLTQPGLGEHPVVSFRVAAYRNESGVDFAPTQAKVAELAEYLLAEYEAAAAKVEAKAGCKKAALCPDYHDRALLKGTRRCWACSSDQHLKPDCPWGPPDGQTAAVASAKSADSGAKGGKGPKGTGKGGKAKKGDGASKLQRAQEQEAGEGQEVGAGAAPTTTADLLKEATEVIRSLKLKALVVKHERPSPERMLEVRGRHCEEPERTGLLDTGASTSMRRARPGELDEGCELRNVNLAVGTVKLFVNSGGTLLSTEDIDPLVSVADLVDMGCQLSWCGNECLLTHPARGVIRPSTFNKCPEVPYELALELIGDVEAYRRAQRVVIKALREEAASLSSQDFAVLQHQLCQAARGDAKVGVLMSAWLSHKFGDFPACVVDDIALQSDCCSAGAMSKWPPQDLQGGLQAVCGVGC